MNLDNLDLANLVGEVMDEIVEFLNFFELQNIIQKGPYLDLPWMEYQSVQNDKRKGFLCHFSDIMM